MSTQTSSLAHAEVSRREKSQLELTDQTNLLPFRKILPIFLGLSLCIVTSTLDSVIVATSLPTVSSAFNAGAIVSWVPSATLLTSTAFQPLYGRFSDIFGRKAALATAMSIFMIGNLLSGFSRTITQLIAFRGFAGVGQGGILSIAQIIVSDIVSLRERGKYQGIMGAVVAVGYAIGPIIGGLLAEKVTWRWCFWITIPVSACAVGVVIFILPLKPVQGDIRRKLLAIDYVGSALTLIGCILIILPLIWGGVTFPWNSPVVLAPLCCGAFVMVLFCLWEWKGAKLPIVPMYIFKHVTVTGVYITMFVNGFIFWSSVFYLPQFFQIVLAFAPIQAGTFLIPMVGIMMVSSWTAGLIVSKTGKYRTLIYSGFTIWAVGCGCLSTVTTKSHKGVLVVYMLLSGTGSGLTLQTTTVAAQASVPRKDMAVVTAFRNFIRLLGGTLALAISSTIINNSLRQSMFVLDVSASTVQAIIDDPITLSSSSPGEGITPQIASMILEHGYIHGFRILFILNASLSAVATLASMFMIKHKELIRPDEAQLKAIAAGKEKEKGPVAQDPEAK